MLDIEHVVTSLAHLASLAKTRDDNTLAEFKTVTYASGEEHDPLPPRWATGSFVVALFFAILHLGVLMIGSSGLSAVAGPYLLGLILALIALILG